MKILYVCTIGSTMHFFKRFVKELIENGHTVDIACNNSEVAVIPYFYELGCKVHTISTSRSPLNKGNISAIKQIRKIVEDGGYDIVHCHTPIAAMCTRLACKKLRKTRGVKVIYTAHGFHFYKGAPLKNWLLFYPIEKLCAKYTDTLITINQEDYELAKRKFKKLDVIRIPGAGIEFEKFNSISIDKNSFRCSLGLSEDDVMLLSAGMVNKNKNHRLVIEALALLKNPKVHYFVAGKGNEISNNIELAKKLGLKDTVHFLGFRHDMPELDACADLFVFPSIREGLGLAAIEAMAAGTPCIGMNTRGIKEYIIDDKTGYLFENNPEKCKNALIKFLSLSDQEKKDMAVRCKEISKEYDYSITNNYVRDIYRIHEQRILNK